MIRSISDPRDADQACRDLEREVVIGTVFGLVQFTTDDAAKVPPAVDAEDKCALAGLWRIARQPSDGDGCGDKCAGEKDDEATVAGVDVFERKDNVENQSDDDDCDAEEDVQCAFVEVVGRGGDNQEDHGSDHVWRDSHQAVAIVSIESLLDTRLLVLTLPLHRNIPSPE